VKKALGIERAYPKVNIFLKVVGIKGEYHLIKSRFQLVTTIWDTLEIREGSKFNFFIDRVNCPLRENLIFKAYNRLIKIYPEFREWFIGKEIYLRKGIPEGSGLGGGSSDAAAFLRLVNKLGGFGLTLSQLAEIGAEVGKDVPFFIYGYKSANVSGLGEIVEPFEEEELELELFTPPIGCETGKVYRYYRTYFLNQPKGWERLKKSLEEGMRWERTPSRELLEQYLPERLNDLLIPALSLYPKLSRYRQFGFFSGSGSSFFRIKN